MTKDALPPTQGEVPMPSRAAAPSSSLQSPAAHPSSAVDTLKQAMRRARQDNAERASVVSDLRTARFGRLELLYEALKPLVAQIPADVDTIDVGLVPTLNPRLFIDMIGFIEMGRDARQYRLLQDTRTGRITLAESEDVDTMVDAVTDYVARRLLERDKALAADTPISVGAAPRPAAVPAGSRPLSTVTVVPGPGSERSRPDQSGPPPSRPVPHKPAAPRSELPRSAPSRPGPNRPRRFSQLFTIAFSFLIDLLGSIALFSALAFVAWYVWNRLHVAI